MMPRPADPPMRTSRRCRDERGDYAIFFAVVAVALFVLAGIAYDAPRLINARSHASHLANEAARVASATVAAGGTLEEAREAARERVEGAPPLYGTPALLGPMQCVGTRVAATVFTAYGSVSALGIFWHTMPITATGTAETVLIAPDGRRAEFSYLSECPLLG